MAALGETRGQRQSVGGQNMLDSQRQGSISEGRCVTGGLGPSTQVVIKEGHHGRGWFEADTGEPTLPMGWDEIKERGTPVNGPQRKVGGLQLDPVVFQAYTLWGLQVLVGISSPDIRIPEGKGPLIVLSHSQLLSNQPHDAEVRALGGRAFVRKARAQAMVERSHIGLSEGELVVTGLGYLGKYLGMPSIYLA